MMPVAVSHVGWVRVRTGAGGAGGRGLTVTSTGDEMHVLSVDLLTRMVCGPGEIPVNSTDAWNVPPSILY